MDGKIILIIHGSLSYKNKDIETPAYKICIYSYSYIYII